MKKHILGAVTVLLVFLTLLAMNVAQADTWGAPYNWRETTIAGFSADNDRAPMVIYSWFGAGHTLGVCNHATATFNVCDNYTPTTCPGWDGTEFAFSPCGIPPDVWFDIDLSQFGVPASTIEVALQGEGIITPSGSYFGTPNLWYQCRAPGSSFPSGNYGNQAIGQNIPVSGYSVGARTPFISFCPVIGDKIEVIWHHNFSDPTKPDDNNYLVSLSLAGYFR